MLGSGEARRPARRAESAGTSSAYVVTASPGALQRAGAGLVMELRDTGYGP
jgi:hypothetical protein